MLTSIAAPCSSHFPPPTDALNPVVLLGARKSAPQAKKPDRQTLVLGFRVADLEGTIQELRVRGICLIGEIGEHKGQRWVEFIDPEGNHLEIKEL